MSDGGGESGRESDDILGNAELSGGGDFGRSVSRIAIAQICKSAGFHSIRTSALDALSDVVIRCIGDLGRISHYYASVAGRTCCNVFDVLQGLKDLGLSRGFAGELDGQISLVDSIVASAIAQYVGASDEVPFAQPVPLFPIVHQGKSTPTFAQVEEVPAGKHIPAWLPAFPDAHTYVHTSVWDERKSEPRLEKIEQSRQRRKAERSLLSLQQKLASYGPAVPVAEDDGDSGEGKQKADSIPFLSPPLPCDEEEAPPMAIPTEGAAENRQSVLETFASAIEAVKNGVLDSGVGETKILPNMRPFVRFKLDIDKKSVPVPLSFHASGAGRTNLWFFKDDERDDKKRRAELILKEAIENPQELVQL